MLVRAARSVRIELIALALAAVVVFALALAAPAGTVIVRLPKCEGVKVTEFKFAGGDGGEVIRGTLGRDVIVGGGGDDKILGLGGDDRICGEKGSDTINGGGGGDRIFGGPIEDLLRGGGGSDEIFGEGGEDGIAGGAGADKSIRGGAGADVIDGEGGNDPKIAGGADNDNLFGGAGNDRMLGQEGIDTLAGERGNDRLDGNGDRDGLSGGPGKDSMEAGSGIDDCDGGSGADFCDGGPPHPADPNRDPDVCAEDVERKRSCREGGFSLYWQGDLVRTSQCGGGGTQRWNINVVFQRSQHFGSFGGVGNALYTVHSGSARLAPSSCVVYDPDDPSFSCTSAGQGGSGPVTGDALELYVRPSGQGSDIYDLGVRGSAPNSGTTSCTGVEPYPFSNTESFFFSREGLPWNSEAEPRTITGSATDGGSNWTWTLTPSSGLPSPQPRAVKELRAGFAF
jgi:Ca2+-binding RTX toxin-like protein